MPFSFVFAAINFNQSSRQLLVAGLLFEEIGTFDSEHTNNLHPQTEHSLDMKVQA